MDPSVAKIEIDESYTLVIFAIGKTSADESNFPVFNSYADLLSMWKE